MRKLISVENFSQIFINNMPLIDTRAPVEFERGSFPYAQNLPLMNNKQRELVGVCYKNKGQAQAIKLGHKLIQGQVRQNCINKWLEFIKNNPNGALYCFRGGLRSQITQEWIFDACGVDYPRVKGGYKALRRFLIDETQRIMANISPIVIGGQTGCGKTLLLNNIKAKIDLEGLANHRGSAFGHQTTPQPSQIDFENALAIELIKKQRQRHLIFEDEGANIGTVHIPQSITEKTILADLVLIQTDLATRISISMNAYVLNMHRDFTQQNAVDGFANFANYWLGSLKKIQKRLGLERYKNLHKLLNSALNRYQTKNEPAGFYPLLESLLVDYYDPMYDYQIDKKHHRIVFQGNSEEVLSYLNDKSIN